jgi:DNA-directed RNA polymerase subunit RPC12/RpoP
VFGPIGRRRSWWYTYRCATCGAYLFGRARDLDTVTGERRAGCGHKVRIVAARIYSQPATEVGA